MFFYVYLSRGNFVSRIQYRFLSTDLFTMWLIYLQEG